MNYEDKTFLIGIALITGLAVVFVLLALWGESVSCSKKWQGTYESEYSVFGKCRVKIDGKFIPEANVREFKQ